MRAKEPQFMEKDDNIVYNINISDSVITGDLKIDTSSLKDLSEDDLSEFKKQQFQQSVAELLLKLEEKITYNYSSAKFLQSLNEYTSYAHFWNSDFAMHFFISLRDHWEGMSGFYEEKEDFESYYVATKNSITYNNRATKYGFDKEGAEFWEWQAHWYGSEKYRKAGLYHKAQECYFNINNLNNKLINDWISLQEKISKMKDEK